MSWVVQDPKIEGESAIWYEAIWNVAIWGFVRWDEQEEADPIWTIQNESSGNWTEQ